MSTLLYETTSLFCDSQGNILNVAKFLRNKNTLRLGRECHMTMMDVHMGLGGRGQSEYSDGEAMQTYLQFTLKA